METTISVISNKKECYECHKTTNLHLHHIFFGKNRKKCNKDKLVVYLCYDHHEGTNGVHGKNGHKLDLKLKRIAELKWLEGDNKIVEDFIQRYGKNYLEEE